MAWAFLVVGLLGFTPTYWIPLLRGTLDVRPLTHIHALLFYGWLVLFVRQTTLVASGRTSRHREMGVAGVSLATAMCFVGVATALQTLRQQLEAGFDESARAFAIVPLSSVVLFAGLFIVAVVNVKRSDVHKRLMLVATATLLQAGVARWFLIFLAPDRLAGPTAPPPPLAVTLLPSAAIDLFIVAMIVHDRRTRGRVHPAYWYAGAVVLAIQLLRVPLSGSGMWMGTTSWLLSLVP
jgi:hypothetical protein